MRILQIGADRSKRGILVPGSAAYERQVAYAERFGSLDIIGFSLKSDGFEENSSGALRTIPTESSSRLFFGLDAIRIASKMPWPDVVSVQDPFETGLTAYFIARFTGRPLHVQVHTDFLSPAYGRLSLLNRIRVHLAGFVLHRAARVRVVSARIKVSLETRYRLAAPITVLPIFVSLEQARAAQPPADLKEKFARFSKKFLYVGRLEKEKHPCLALESFAVAASKDACLIIVGSGSERTMLEQRAQRLDISSRVFFEGETDGAPYFALADLVIVPSRYEGYGLVIVEALAAGKPVLATDVGIAKEAGAIVAEETAFVTALRAWIESGPRAGKLVSYPYASFEQYVEAYCADIEACLR